MSKQENWKQTSAKPTTFTAKIHRSILGLINFLLFIMISNMEIRTKWNFVLHLFHKCYHFSCLQNSSGVGVCGYYLYARLIRIFINITSLPVDLWNVYYNENCLIHQVKTTVLCEVSYGHEKFNMEPDSLLLINIMLSFNVLLLAYKYIFC